MRASGFPPRPSVSPAALLLTLLATTCSRLKQKAITSLCDTFEQAMREECLTATSLWFDSALRKDLQPVTFETLRNALEAILCGPLLTEVVAGPLLELGISLLNRCIRPVTASGLSKQMQSWMSLSSPTVHCLPRPAGVSAAEGLVGLGQSLAELGSWIVATIFQLCSYTRRQVVRHVVPNYFPSVEMR